MARRRGADVAERVGEGREFTRTLCGPSVREICRHLAKALLAIGLKSQHGESFRAAPHFDMLTAERP
jgi:hypothetical protein